MGKKEQENLDNCHTIELDIEGMDCPSCALKIEKKVSKLKGVQNVKVDLGSETATIEYSDDQQKLENIKKEIHELGYKATEPDIDEAEKESENKKQLHIRKLRNK